MEDVELQRERLIIYRQFFLFLVNGGVLGFLAWAVQLGVFYMMGEDSYTAYTLSTVVIYPPLVLINFLVQKKLIFNKSGRLRRFIMINLLMMLLMAILSPFFRWLLMLCLGDEWGDALGFALAALAVAPVSFVAMRYWVFRHVRMS